MPELPDVVIYREALQRRLVDRVLERVDLKSPFVVRTFEPDISKLAGQRLENVERMGKRIVWRFESDLFAVFHLMIAGRFHQRKPGTRPRSKTDLSTFHFSVRGGAPGSEIDFSLALTEASPKKRASIHVVRGATELAQFDRGGLDVLSADLATFAQRLASENHTLKRSLTDPRMFDGIGNAFSDEILHAARLSPIKWTSRLEAQESQRLYAACRQTLSLWIDRLRQQAGDGFPEKVTAFRPEMAVHGKFGEPCPVCKSAGIDTAVQRIRYASNETNYCPRCQTGGKLLADRSLSRLLKDDWPRTVEELEQ